MPGAGRDRAHGGVSDKAAAAAYRLRQAGDTVALSIDTFHRIDYVPPQGAYTLFISFGPSRGWGFEVDGTTMPWRDYLATRGNGGPA